MRYKGEYKPSELLCPTSLQWFPIEQSILLLDENKFSPLHSQLARERKRLEVKVEVKVKVSDTVDDRDRKSVV